VKLVGAESTKTVHQFATGDVSGITYVGWSKNLTRNVIDLPGSFKNPRVWQDALSEASTEFDTRETLNLPRELSQIDIETSLPKLSVLASGGTS
jgi:anaphase-promoting complex subunit 4